MMMRLDIHVGEPQGQSLARMMELAQRIDRGESIVPLCEIGFDKMARFGEVFTPKRWELIESLKTAGPLTIYALAKRLGRHYRNVHKDVTALMEWMVVEKDESGKVFVPWDEIDVRCPLLQRAA